MPVLRLPELSDAIAVATVARWVKKPGETFAVGDVLVELEAERALVRIEAASAGTLAEIIAQPGKTIGVGAELARIEVVASATAAGAKPTAEKTMSQNGSGGGGRVVPILMPQAGNTMEEGAVLSWRVKEGEQVRVGQVICEIETDKATIDFESPDAGRLARIVAKVGQPVPVKEPIALLADSDADADAYLGGQGASSSVQQQKSTVAAVPAQLVAAPARGRAGPAAVTAEGRVKASPAARKIAAERGIDVAAMGQGSGPRGRILSGDVARAAAGGARVAGGASDGKAPAERRTSMSKMRRAIGLNLQASKQTIPHFYVRTKIDAEPLMAFYRQHKSQTSCTLNDVVVLAVGRAMSECPAVRSQINGNDVVEFPHANIGVAVGVDEGLVVPVVLNVDTLSLAQLAAETKRIVENSRKGKLENIGKGNFTITNLGMFGVDEFSAIINPPESGILAVGAAKEDVIVQNGALRAGRTMTMTLSADHRIVDGVVAAKFMGRLREMLESPENNLA
jgi:pyruvate dehydrogenase E2 component (dihydrolipoamide acetyltransferase)